MCVVFGAKCFVRTGRSGINNAEFLKRVTLVNTIGADIM